MQLVNIAIMQTLQLNGLKIISIKDDIIEAYGGVKEVAAKDIVDDIFCESDSWYDDFIKNLI